MLELVFEAKGYESDFSSRDGGEGFWLAVGREQRAQFIVKASSVAVLPVEDTTQAR